jgi:hypothetical protein
LVLGLLAVAQILEREARFGETVDSLALSLRRASDETAGRLDSLALSLRPASSSRLLGLTEIPPLEKDMRGAYELFYTGGHLHSLLHSHTNLFRQWLLSGKALKFLLQNPDNTGLLSLTMPCVNYEGERYVAQIRDSLRILRDLKTARHGDLQVRVTDVTPTQSVSILDGHRGGTLICLLLHLPEGESRTGAFLRLTRDTDSPWFQLFFERYYQLLWSSSKAVI